MADIEVKADWERVTSCLDRIKVEGGFLYRAVTFNSYAMSFVPDVDLSRYQSHLRDAYNKGFEDGREAMTKAINQF